MQAAARSYKWSILLLALSATLREGIESVLFLTGVSQARPALLAAALAAALPRCHAG